MPLIGRFVDAFTDPLMGRLSDHTHWKSGRRRPYFLIGAIPYGIAFSLLWWDVPFASQAARFAYYTGAYCLLSVAMTVLSVPYLAIQPEMATDYDERTSLNTYRTAGSIFGVFAAVSIRPVAEAFGGGGPGFASAGVLFGVAFALPWFAVHRVTFERRDYQVRPAETGVIEGVRLVAKHATFMRLTAIYIMGRIAMDLASALIILYVSFWLGRSGDFEPVMFLFLSSVVLALPFWLRISAGRDKARVFVLGSVWWMSTTLFLIFIQPEWPRWLMFVFVPVIGVGYAVVDVMPWSMLGEVIDEDDLETGERREGLYNGFFTFVRKLGGALGVSLVLGILDLAGMGKGETQNETARQAIRWLTALGPAFFLGVGVWLARGYPLTRAAHRRIVSELENRRGTSPAPAISSAAPERRDGTREHAAVRRPQRSATPSAPTPGREPRVFVSYSHEGSEHERWVVQLASDLRRNGVDVVLDRWDLRLGGDIAAFMESGIGDSDRVLMVCSADYVRKAEAGRGGVGYEKLIVTGELMRDQRTEKFIPVVRGNAAKKKTPSFVSSRLHIDFDDDAEYATQLERLLREIHGAHEAKPELGTNPFQAS